MWIPITSADLWGQEVLFHSFIHSSVHSLIHGGSQPLIFSLNKCSTCCILSQALPDRDNYHPTLSPQGRETWQSATVPRIEDWNLEAVGSCLSDVFHCQDGHAQVRAHPRLTELTCGMGTSPLSFLWGRLRVSSRTEKGEEKPFADCELCRCHISAHAL
jgi:hypothetical protein